MNSEWRKGDGRDIEERTFAFAVRVVRLVQGFPREEAGRVIGRQLLRAGTSVGANVEEAQGAQSRKDFARIMSIARSEAREALYWLRLAKATLPLDDFERVTTEADELVRILTTIVKKTREGA